MFERLKSLLIKEFLQLFRDPRMKTILFAAPVVQVIIFGYAVSTNVRNIPTAVYDLDQTPESRALIREFTASHYFHIRKHIQTDTQQNALLDQSLVSVVIRIQPGFAGDLLRGRTAKFQLLIDGTDSNTTAVIQSYANHILERLLSRRNTHALPHIELRNRSWWNENLESRNFYIPGVIAHIISLITLLLTAMAIVREKEIGTLEQLIVSPLKSHELILGKLLPFALIGIIDVLLVTVVGVFWFDVPIRGSLTLLFGSACLYLLTTLGIGLFISTISNTQQEALMSTFLFYFPTLLLSGFLFPIANMPQAIQWLTLLNPLRYFLVILRSLFLKGSGFETLWPQLLALLVIGLTIFTLSALRFRKRLG